MLLLSPGLHAQSEPLRINTASVEPFVKADRQGFIDLLVAEVFRRIGTRAEINQYQGASARSLQMANSGNDDGEALRVKGQEKNFPNLIRVPEPMIVNQFVAYSRDNAFQVRTWGDLKSHRVGYLIGWWIFKRNLEDAPDVTAVKSADQLFGLLRAERVDVALYEKWQGLWVANSMGLRVTVQEPALAQVEMFMYLHRKHEALVPEAAKALKAMKADGSYQRIVDQVLTPMLAQ